MKPITREEYYLAKIAGTWQGKTPEPVTIEEYYLATMAGDYSGNTPHPVTRLQYYMAKVAGVWDGSIPAPVTRLEYYWAAIANGEGKVFPPVTREEHFLVLVADAYSVVLTVVTGNPALLENSKGNRGLESLTLHGISTQVSTTGANLLPFSVGQKGDGFEVFADGIQIDVQKYTAIYILGREGFSYESSYDEFALLTAGVYYIYSDNANVEMYINAWRQGKGIEIGAALKGSVNKMVVMDGDKFRIFLAVKGAFNGKVQVMISKIQPTEANYEPYTGGKPSPSPEYPQDIKSAGDKGQVDISILGANLAFYNKTGTSNDAVAYLYGLQKFYIKAKRLTGTSQVNCRFYYENGMKGDDIYILTKGESKNEVIRAVNAKYPVKHIAIYAVGVSGDNPITELEYLMVSPENIPYEPYKPAQTLIIPTPNGLPGIPVSSGGNYTDEKGQQWICDEIDLERGKYVQRVKEVNPADYDDWILDDSTEPIRFKVNRIPDTINERKRFEVLSNRFVFNSENKVGVSFAYADEIYFYLPSTVTTVEQAKQWFVDNPTTLMYMLGTPIEINLTPEEIAAYKALRTYGPTTVITNDAGAGMEVTYVAER